MCHCIHSLGFFIIFSPERNVQAFVDGRVSSRMCTSQNPSRGGKEPHVKEVRDGRVIYNPVSRFWALLDFLFPGVLGSTYKSSLGFPSLNQVPSSYKLSSTKMARAKRILPIACEDTQNQNPLLKSTRGICIYTCISILAY